MLLYLPLALDAVAVPLFLTTDESYGWKAIAVAMLAASLCFQFIPALQFHFLIPLLIQTVLAVWMAIYWKVGM